MQPEAKFKKKLKESFEEVFSDCPHFWFPLVASALQMAGVPDLFAAVYGRTVWIEAKVNTGKLRPTQQVVLPRMARAGARVIVAYADMDVEKEKRHIDLTFVDADGHMVECLMVRKWNALNSIEFWDTVMGMT